MTRLLVFIVGMMLASTSAYAGCACQCVNGEMQPLCDSAIDLPPICPPTICGIAPPSIPPIAAPILPPLGTSYCRQAQVCDTWGNCRWQQVCRWFTPPAFPRSSPMLATK
jgi:hypothetical protein